MSETSKKSPFKDGVLYTDIGSNIQPVYERKFDQKTGKSLVVQTSTFDIDEYIQASNCQTDLAMLRQEMIATGQLPTISDEVVDATLFPENIHEVYKTINDVDKIFNDLPESVKSSFKDKNDFMASLIDGSYGSRAIKGIQAAYVQNEGQVKQEEKKEEGKE